MSGIIGGAGSKSGVIGQLPKVTAGAIGAYAFLKHDLNNTDREIERTAGYSTSGGLWYTSASTTDGEANAASGTWQLMGFKQGSGGPESEHSSLWIRTA